MASLPVVVVGLPSSSDQGGDEVKRRRLLLSDLPKEVGGQQATIYYWFLILIANQVLRGNPHTAYSMSCQALRLLGRDVDSLLDSNIDSGVQPKPNAK